MTADGAAQSILSGAVNELLSTQSSRAACLVLW
jgi:hypothetical protein